MKLYVISCFDELVCEDGHTSGRGCKEIAFIFYDKRSASKCIDENWCDFQDHAYAYCELAEVRTHSYLPMHLCKRKFYRFVYDAITRTGKWVQLEVADD